VVVNFDGGGEDDSVDGAGIVVVEWDVVNCKS